MSDTETEPFSQRRVLQDSKDLLRRAPVLFVGLAVVFVLIPQVAGGILLIHRPETGNLINLPLAMVGLIGKVAMTWAAMQMLSGRTVDLGQALSGGAKFFWGGLGVSILTSIGIGLGLLLVIAPGLFLMTIWAVALPAYIARGDGVSTALSESSVLTKGSRWNVFGLMLAIWGAYWVLIAVGIGLNVISEQATVVSDVVVMPLAVSAAELATGIIAPALYHELRHRGRGTADQTAEVFA